MMRDGFGTVEVTITCGYFNIILRELKTGACVYVCVYV